MVRLRGTCFTPSTAPTADGFSAAAAAGFGASVGLGTSVGFAAAAGAGAVVGFGASVGFAAAGAEVGVNWTWGWALLNWPDAAGAAVGAAGAWGVHAANSAALVPRMPILRKSRREVCFRTAIVRISFALFCRSAGVLAV
jgi:hypothetical protein